eukprot:CAMPEP_0176308126 /NCGR_PEP_ID=MMETSP0121_2-20121125/64380_1 /TAXON_ID=160619 /ORGANISM="Kryptoperidinium foliaceum, Strain CCMP 1326" /LENGTH=43 /DNA_ID= /DNA_START= /DNA_END= /DNA_ORIENTATION=
MSADLQQKPMLTQSPDPMSGAAGRCAGGTLRAQWRPDDPHVYC